MKMMKTIVIALAVLLGTAGLMAAGEAKCDPETGICEIPADAKKVCPKAKCTEACKADLKKALPNSKAELAKDPKNGIGTQLADLPIPGFCKHLDKVRDTQWQYLVEYEDEVFSWYKLPDGRYALVYKETNKPGTLYSVTFQKGQKISAGREIMIVTIPGRSKAKVKNMHSFLPLALNPALEASGTIQPGMILAYFAPELLSHDSIDEGNRKALSLGSISEIFGKIWTSTGLYDVIKQTKADFSNTWLLGLGRVLMMIVGIVLLYLAIVKEFEPLLLLPIGFGAILANIPVAAISGPDGLLGMVYQVGIESGVFPLLIFMGVGAMTDFGPLIANPKTALLGGAAQFAIFSALLGALILSKCGIYFDLKDAASIGIIGGADGPTAIYLTSKLSPKLLGSIAVAAYSYMALVPIIQPPIMRALTTEKERKIRMSQLRPVHKLEKICFPVLITLLCAFLLPDAAPLIGMLMFGNLMRECGVVERLNQTAQNALCNIVTIFLGLSVGSKLSADQFLNMQTLGILILGCVAFCFGTAAGIIFAKIMNLFLKEKINPLLGSAGVSAVPMAARVANKVGLEADPQNFLLMHAMGPNVSGVIGSAVAAGLLLNALGGL